MRLRPNKSKKDHLQKERMKAFAGPFEEYRNIIEKNKPFYSPIVYKALSDILEKCYSERINFENSERDRHVNFKEAMENRQQIIVAIDFACESIRNRINEIKVV